MNFLDILTAVVPVFLIIGLGCVTRVTGILNDAAEKSVMNLVLWVLYPCFILWKVPGNESLKDPAVVGISIAVGCILTVVSFAIAWSLGWVSKISAEDGRGTFAISAGLQNYGFIPIPLIIAVFGDLADETLGVLFVHNLGVEIAMWTIGLIILSGNWKGSWKRLINGPTIAIATGLLLNCFSGLGKEIPVLPELSGFLFQLGIDIASSTVAQLGTCAIPVSLVLVGAALAGVVQSEKWETKWNVICSAMAVRFAIMPVVFLSVAALVSFSPNLQRVLIVEAAMPAAVFPVVLAKHFGGKPGVAVQVVIATSVASLILTPSILSIALRLFGVEV